VPNKFINKINATKTLDELFAVLIACDYCSWIYVRILERMAAFSRQVKAEKLITKHKRIIFSKKLVDIFEDILDLKLTDDYYTRV